jgi:hypothetical protein
MTVRNAHARVGSPGVAAFFLGEQNVAENSRASRSEQEDWGAGQ